MSETNTQHPEIPVLSHPRYIEGTQENAALLERFGEAITELQEQDNVIAGATLFGSRLKGTNREDSDVDCQLLLDADQFAAQGVNVEVDKTGKLAWSDDGTFAENYKRHLSDQIAASAGMDPDFVAEGLYIEPISEKIIKDQIQLQSAYHRDVTVALDTIDTWFNDLTASDVAPEFPEYVGIGDAVPALFAPDLTPGLDKYRRAVIDELSQLGPDGEAVWQDILEGVSFGEGHVDRSDPHNYPQNVDEARNWYVTES